MAKRLGTVVSHADRVRYLRASLVHLRRVLAMLGADVAPKATRKVRSALKSAEGALRHAEGMVTRETELERTAETDTYLDAPCALCQSKEHGSADCPHNCSPVSYVD